MTANVIQGCPLCGREFRFTADGTAALIAHQRACVKRTQPERENERAKAVAS